MRKTLAGLCLVSLCAGAWAARSGASVEDAPVREGPTLLDPRANGVGRLVDDVAVATRDGKAVRLSLFRGRPVVVCMTAAGCPVSMKYLPVLEALEREYHPRGVAFVLVNAKDPGSAAAVAALGARSTTDTFVLDAARTLVYRGAVDDQFGLGYSLAKPRRTFLRDAVDAALANKPPDAAATSAPGCELQPAAAPPAAAPPVTYHNQISRTIAQYCAECHRPGENGPFTLTSYQDVKENLATIKRVVRRGVMPPWHADPKVGHWANDRSLPERAKADLLAWIDAGAPEGSPADAPVGRQFVAGWKIGKPDAVFEVPRVFRIPATGAMEYQRAVVQTDLPEDKWVTAVEIRPTQPAVVHHVLVFVIYPKDHPRRGDQPKYNGGVDGYFAGLVPGHGHHVYPRGTAKFLPKGAMLMFQIHYTPNGTATADQPKIGFQFSDSAPEHELSTRGAFNKDFRIPPHDPDYAVTAAHVFRRPARLLSFMPHSHVRGKAYRYELVYPGGRTETVLNLPRYDFNWQIEYFLRDPIDVPAGTRLKVTAWYDNSDKNPANPDPTATVGFGDQTWNEMMIGYFSGYALKEQSGQQ
jgi:mono/diheme cytochrome c family protein